MLSSFLRCGLLVAVCAVLASAQSTTVYFTAQSTPGTYPATCTTGALSCSPNATGYACTSGTVSGTHYYYPAASAPTFNASLVVGQPPTLCEQYYADSQLPLTTGGLNVRYGALSTCVNYRQRTVTSNGVSTTVLTADPDAVDAPILFNYSTTASAVPSCPAAVAATGSGSQTVYFTYLGLNTSGVSICGSGSLSCTYYGNNQYYCPTLNSGTHYQYNASTKSYQTVSLTQEVECNGFGDGYLPLDYEGISFGGAFNAPFGCISWYGESAGTKQGYDFYSTNSLNSYTYYPGTTSFTYSTTQTTSQTACAAYIPGLTPSSSAWATASYSAALLLAATAAALALLL